MHSTWNYRQLQHYCYSHSLQVTRTSVLRLLCCPLVVSWKWIHNSVTVTSHMKSSLHSLIPFLPLFSVTFNYRLSILFCRLPTTEPYSVLVLAAWDLHYVALGWIHRKHSILYCCLLIHCCRDVFITQLHSNECGVYPHLFYCCVTSQHIWWVPLLHVYGPLPSNSCFSASTVSCFEQICHSTVTWHLKARSAQSEKHNKDLCC
jgi:hypothetical protein